MRVWWRMILSHQTFSMIMSNDIKDKVWMLCNPQLQKSCWSQNNVVQLQKLGTTSVALYIDIVGNSLTLAEFYAKKCVKFVIVHTRQVCVLGCFVYVFHKSVTCSTCARPCHLSPLSFDVVRMLIRWHKHISFSLQFCRKISVRGRSFMFHS